MEHVNHAGNFMDRVLDPLAACLNARPATRGTGRARTTSWALSPDIRIGQLMAHIGFLGEAHVGKGLGYIDDLARVVARGKLGPRCITL